MVYTEDPFYRDRLIKDYDEPGYIPFGSFIGDINAETLSHSSDKLKSLASQLAGILNNKDLEIVADLDKDALLIISKTMIEEE